MAVGGVCLVVIHFYVAVKFIYVVVISLYVFIKGNLVIGCRDLAIIGLNFAV